MRKSHIFFCVRKNFLDEPGGDTDQALTWKAVLEQLENRVTNIEDALAALQRAYADGKIISSVNHIA